MGGHLPRIDNNITNLLVANLAPPYRYNDSYSELLWLDYTTKSDQDYWLGKLNFLH